jgi:hypothetical protein
MRTWEISRIKGTPAAILGRIKAPDAETAVKEWIEKFGITDPEQQNRLVARSPSEAAVLPYGIAVPNDPSH